MKKNYFKFLIDVFLCALGAYGGPEAHFGIFNEQLVRKKKYLEEEELLELIAVTTSLPGPSSTQTIVAIGYKQGGILLALLTFIVWAIPAIIIMTLFALFVIYSNSNEVSLDILRYLTPMAIGFVIVASYRIGKKVVISKYTLFMFLFSATVTMFYRNMLIFVGLILFGAISSIILSKEKNLWNKVKVKSKISLIFIFFLILIASIVLVNFNDLKLLNVFSRFYQFGSLVIGGGQVVIPYMYQSIVENLSYITSNEFLLGYGVTQGIPGPMFGFSSYVGALVFRDSTLHFQILGSLVASIGIFLPGILIILFFYPVWNQLKKINGIKVSLKGILAVSAGFILSMAITLTYNLQGIDYFIILVLSTVLILLKKIPIPIILLLMILLGVFI